MDIDKPYIEELKEQFYWRTFNENIPENLLKWHFDDEDRTIYPVNKTDWKFQFDNELPFIIESEIFIPKGVYHRLLKGTNNLTLKIKKHE